MAKLEISKVATEDLIEIEYYISIKLCNEQAAFKIIDGILDLCENLKCNPKRYPLVRFEELRVLGTRIAFYKKVVSSPSYSGFRTNFPYNYRKFLLQNNYTKKVQKLKPTYY